MRAVAIACLLPVPIASAAPPALVEPQQSGARALFSAPHDLEPPLGRLAGDLGPVRQVDAARSSTDAGTDTGVVTVPASKARVRAASLAGDHDIPAAALTAYRGAAATLRRTDPGCRIDWALLAGIGRVESDHGRYAGTTVHVDGTTSPHIVGLPLDGSPGVAAISDSDGGRLDGDTVWDRAVGPMQFIPTTWSMVAADGDGDGVRDPHDLDDAALAAGVYLCAGDDDLGTRSGAEAAVFRYNHSDEYVALVLSLAESYRSGVVAVPSTPADGDGSAPSLDEVPDTPPNGERNPSPADREADDRKADDRKADDRKADDRAEPKTSGQQPPGRGSAGGGQPTPNEDETPKPSGDDGTPAGADDGGSNGDGADNAGGDGNDGDADADGDSGGDADGDNGDNGGGGDAGDGGGDADGGDQTDPPADDAEPVRISGTLESCEDTFCVTEPAEDGQDATTWTLDVTDVGADPAADDFDHDTAKESVRAELDGVAQHHGTVTLDVRRTEAGDAALLVRIVDADVPEREHGPAEPRSLTGTLVATDAPEVWAFAETGPDGSTWTLDLSAVDLATADADEDGATLDQELAAIAEKPETTLTVGTGDRTVVQAVDGLALTQFDITATPQENGQ